MFASEEIECVWNLLWNTVSITQGFMFLQIFGFLIFAMDKLFAKCGCQRVPEVVLLCILFISYGDVVSK